MRFYKDTNRIHIDGNELVYLAQSKLAHGLPSDEEMRLGRHETGGMILSLHADVSGMRFQVNATIHKTEQESVTLHYALPQGMTHPSPEISRQARGEVFVAGHIWAEKHNLDKVTLVIVYYSHNGEYICTEHASESKLSTFFVRLLHTLTLYHAMELDRVCRRLPTMAQVPYPFPALRLGQDDLISEVYGTLCRGKKLYACAPTGIGKTMSMLFPAVRALGGGVFDKIF